MGARAERSGRPSGAAQKAKNTTTRDPGARERSAPQGGQSLEHRILPDDDIGRTNEGA